MQHRSPAAATVSGDASAAAAAGAMVPGVSGVEPAVTLDQVPRWSDSDQRLYSPSSAAAAAADGGSEPAASAFLSFSDPLTGDDGGAAGGGRGGASRFPVDHEINSRIYLWRGQPWNLEVDAVVNSTNESLDEGHSSPGLHAAAGSGLAEECATLGGCRTGMAKVTNAYDLPARKVIHTVGPKYAVKYHTAAKNALSHCYQSCLELLIENSLERNLPYMQLGGIISPSIGKLDKLQRIALHQNSLHGPIPAEIKNCTKLRAIYLRANYLQGGIPSEIGELIHLTILDLSSNLLRGTIPAAIGSLTHLRFLNLSINFFPGEIPNVGVLGTFKSSS